MRASRILSLLLILQRHGRMSAAELARTLEVSERTVRRDVVALSEAGVPIFAARGYRGGIELLGGFATQLTGLTHDEALSLLLVGQPGVAHRLGLAAPTRLASDKLMTALGPELAGRATNLATWFVHDPDPWDGHRIPHGELRRIATCVQRRRAVELTIGRPPPITVQPLGLVLKAGSWYVVHLAAAGSGDRGRDGVEPPVEYLCIDELLGTRITRNPFEPPAGFDLATHWATIAADQGAAGESASTTARTR